MVCVMKKNKRLEADRVFLIFLTGVAMTFTGSLMFYVSSTHDRPLLAFSSISMLHMGLAVMLFPVFVDEIDAGEVFGLTTIVSVPLIQMVLSILFPYDVSKYEFNEVFLLVLILTMISLCGSVGIGYLAGVIYIQRKKGEVET